MLWVRFYDLFKTINNLLTENQLNEGNLCHGQLYDGKFYIILCLQFILNIYDFTSGLFILTQEDTS